MLPVFIRLVGLAIASFVLVHVFSVFGLFLALAYPVWWLVSPEHTPAVVPRSIGKSETIDTFGKAVLNAGVLLVFSLICLGLVYLESRLLLKGGFPNFGRSAQFLVPSQGQYKLGEIFPMEVRVQTSGTSVNAVQADVRFDPNTLKLVEISTKDSFASIFVNKEVDNTIGFGRLSGGLPSPGFSLDSGLFGTIYFQSLQAGVAKVDFMPSSMVLANDGRGTNILTDFSSTSYFILPEEVSKEQREQQEAQLTSQVLGESTNQMYFYDDTQTLTTVLGTSDIAGENLGARAKKMDLVFEFVSRVDSMIISSWRWLLDSLQGK